MKASDASIPDSLIVGSGPAAIAAAQALIKDGRSVLILDTGISLEPELAALKGRMSAQEPEHWSPDDLARWKGRGQGATLRGVDSKTAFGSNFANQVPRQAAPITLVRAKMARSYSRGGLSNVWGASILPHFEEEIHSWPIPFAEMKAAYSALFAFLPQAAWPDALSARLPVAGSEDSGLEPSRLMASLMEALRPHEASLQNQGLFFGQARLAVTHPSSGQGCRYCGLCMYGCPYDLIYSSSQTLDALISSNAVEYRAGHLVQTFQEDSSGVRVQGVRLHDGQPFEYRGHRLFLGTGVLETARITLRSLGLYNIDWPLLHSDIFLLPILRFRRSRGAMVERSHQMAQLLLEIQNAAISRRAVHLQFYGYNDLYRRALEGMLGVLHRPLQRPIAGFLERLMMVFGYLHSEESSRLSLNLSPAEGGTLRVTGHRNPEAGRIARRVHGKLFRLWRELGGLPLWPRLGPPGYGNHSGCSFPMAEKPGAKESDTLGRPAGLKRVHLVDASVLPSLPATTITLTVMANAHRIASIASRID